jgi:hypothetical protein
LSQNIPASEQDPGGDGEEPGTRTALYREIKPGYIISYQSGRPVSGIFIFPDIDEAMPQLTETCCPDSWQKDIRQDIFVVNFNEILVSCKGEKQYVYMFPSGIINYTG